MSFFCPGHIARLQQLAIHQSGRHVILRQNDIEQPLIGGIAAQNADGSAGEIPGALILLCGLYLVVRQIMEWRIPVAMLAGAAAAAAGFHLANNARFADPFFMLSSGGLMLGAVFMATDPVASPVTPRGRWIYGILMGVLTILIRNLGGLAEGVMYAILLGNALAPLIDKLTPPRTYGERKKAGAQ